MDKKIILNKESFNRLFESVKHSNLNEARSFLKKSGYSLDKANQIVDSVRVEVPNSKLNEYKYILGVTRMYCGGEINDGRDASRLNEALRNAVESGNYYDTNLNGLSMNEFIEKNKGKKTIIMNEEQFNKLFDVKK